MVEQKRLELGAAERFCGLGVRWRGKEGRWEEVRLLWSLGRPNWYWPGNNLLWMEILADELTITQPSSGYLIWLGVLICLAMAGELPSGEAGYLEPFYLVQPAPVKRGISKASLPIVENDCMAMVAELPRRPAGGKAPCSLGGLLIPSPDLLSFSQ